MTMSLSLSTTFRCAKIPRTLPPKSGKATPSSASVAPASGNPSAEAAKKKASAACASGNPSAEAAKKKKASPWCVYLIASSRIPRTYVGVTTDFPRRIVGYTCWNTKFSSRVLVGTNEQLTSLRQHNGELKGGAKAASAGRPWNLACLIEGFVNRSEACEFESNWKNISQKMARKRSKPSMNSVLQHREKALSRVKTFLDCSHLKIKCHTS